MISAILIAGIIIFVILAFILWQAPYDWDYRSKGDE